MQCDSTPSFTRTPVCCRCADACARVTFQPLSEKDRRWIDAVVQQILEAVPDPNINRPINVAPEILQGLLTIRFKAPIPRVPAQIDPSPDNWTGPHPAEPLRPGIAQTRSNPHSGPGWPRPA